MFVTIHSEGVAGSFTKDGNTFRWKTQKGYIHDDLLDFPQRISINIDVDAPDYEQGVEYSFHPDNFVTDENNRLKIARNLLLVRRVSSLASSAAARGPSSEKKG